MIVTKIDNIEINTPENWNEVTLKQMISFIKWSESKPKIVDQIDEVIYNLELIKIFAFTEINDTLLNNLKMTDILDIVNNLKKFSEALPEFVQKEYFIHNKIMYSFVDFNQMSLGEYISYRKMLESFENKLDVLPSLLAIICRPAERKFSVELRKDVYTLSPFDATDIYMRSKVFEQVPAIELMASANFFLTGREIPMNNSMLSSTENQIIKPMDL